MFACSAGQLTAAAVALSDVALSAAAVAFAAAAIALAAAAVAISAAAVALAAAAVAVAAAAGRSSRPLTAFGLNWTSRWTRQVAGFSGRLSGCRPYPAGMMR